MIIGVPKEIKNNENRVALTPAGAHELAARGHTVYVQASAGENSGFSDEDYVAAGAKILPSIEQVYAAAEMIMKVKEPIEPEYSLVRQGQLLFTYFHFASCEPLTRAMIDSGMGADVTICDISLPRLAYLADVMPANVHTLMSSRYNLSEEVRTADLVIGSVLIPGASAPKLVTAEMVRTMKRGAVIVDVAIDQGGCCETSHPTTHENPTYYVDGVLHYAVANIPGAVPCTSTAALTNATLPYAVQLADKGWKRACRDSMELYRGLNVVEGKVTYRGVAEAWGLPYEPVGL